MKPGNISGEVYYPVTIIGGGVCGLRAALDLHAMGVRSLVVEKSNQLGGRLLHHGRWFQLDSCGYCRLVDSESMYKPAGDLNEGIYCLKKEVGRYGLDFLTGKEVVSASRRGDGFLLDVCGGNGGDSLFVSTDVIIVCQGLVSRSLDGFEQFGIGIYEDCISAHEFEIYIEELKNSRCGTGGKLLRKSDGKEVDSICFIGCIGCRDEGNPVCGAVCCGLLAKQISMVRRYFGKSIKTFFTSIDLRAGGKGMFFYLKRALGATMTIRGRAAAVERRKNGRYEVRVATTRGVEKLEVSFVVYSGGFVVERPSYLANLGVEFDESGFPLSGNGLIPLMSTAPSVLCGGSFRNPCDIETSVKEGRACAGLAVEILRKKGKLADVKTTDRRAVAVIGGGVAGIFSARSACQHGHEVYVFEEDESFGGLSRRIFIDAYGLGSGVQELLDKEIEEIENNKSIKVFKGVRVKAITGAAGRFRLVLDGYDLAPDVVFSSVVVATGAEVNEGNCMFDGRVVVSHSDFERMVSEGNVPEGDVVFIQCVNARDDEHPFCSRVCCVKTLRLALGLKSLDEKANVWVLHRDIYCPGRDEIIYQKARQAGIIFIRYGEEERYSIRKEGDSGVVDVFDVNLGRRIVIKSSVVVLATGVEAPDSTVESFLIGIDESGFASQIDSRFLSNRTATAGIYVAGNVRFPCNSREAAIEGLSGGMGAGLFARALGSDGDRESAHVSVTKENLCIGCGICVRGCTCGARYLWRGTEIKARVLTNLCTGCGYCVVACPSCAAELI